MQFWSGTAFMDTADALAVAPMLDAAGFDGMVCSDHLTYPRVLSSPYPDSPTGRPPWAPETPWPDSWVLIGAMAALTTRLRFSNAVYVAPARPLLEVAKQVATAAVISGGRVALGVGVGWMREEFELMGQEFETRGRRLDEMIPALRALWQGGWVSFDGQHYRVPELMLEPHPPAPVPILCGGESMAALRRAARSCDGWIGYAYPLDRAAQFVRQLSALRREYGRADEPFEVLLALTDPPSPELYNRAQDLGITAVMCAPWAYEPKGTAAGAERFRGSIERFAESIIAKVNR